MRRWAPRLTGLAGSTGLTGLTGRSAPALDRLTTVTMDVETPRLSLHATDVAQARRIRDGAPRSGEVWAADYPFEGDLAALGGFIRASVQHGEQRPFGYYQIVRRSDGRAVGGIGFKGPPEAGTVEIGYGLAPSARGQGYASEALTALLRLAGEHGVRRVLADSLVDNLASQRTLEHAGFRRITSAPGIGPGPGADLLHYETRPTRPAVRRATRTHLRSV